MGSLRASPACPRPDRYRRPAHQERGALRRSIEDRTDFLAADPVTALGQTGVETIIAIAAPISRRLFDTGVIPLPNPIGVPRP